MLSLLLPVSILSLSSATLQVKSAITWWQGCSIVYIFCRGTEAKYGLIFNLMHCFAAAKLYSIENSWLQLTFHTGELESLLSKCVNCSDSSMKYELDRIGTCADRWFHHCLISASPYFGAFDKGRAICRRVARSKDSFVLKAALHHTFG
jgi:hypothetical protein